MISEYLNLPIRSRSLIVLSAAVTRRLDWGHLTTLAADLNVAIIEVSGAQWDNITIIRIGGEVAGLTGYSIAELTNAKISVLGGGWDDSKELDSLMDEVERTGHGARLLITERKSGDQIECEVVAMPTINESPVPNGMLFFVNARTPLITSARTAE